MEQTQSEKVLNQQITTGVTGLDDLRQRLTSWLAGREGVEGPVEVSEVNRPDSSGMSNISVLFDATWTPAGSGTPQTVGLVARLGPEEDSFPVFPEYNLALQFNVMNAVRARTGLPVPLVRWVEEDPSVLGTPFLVMDRATGQAPVDNPPYIFDGWLLEMDAESRREFQRESVAVLAAVHQIADPAAAVPSIAPSGSGDSLRAHVDDQREYYEWTIREDGLRIPLIDRTFEWIEANWPAETGPDVLSWGDSRIGNILYEGTTPTAVLDWESAGIAPAEVDLGWFLYFHDMFQDLAVTFGFPGIPDLFDRGEVVAQYEEATGTKVRDLDFYYVYAGLRQAIIMSRIHRRRIHFGEAEAPENPDEYVLHHPMLERLIAD